MDAKNQPFYGGGFQGWARKTFGNIFDPQEFGVEDASAVEEAIPKAEKIIEEKTNWGEWGEGFFGISAKELAEPFAAISVAGMESRESDSETEQVGEKIAFETGLARRAAGQFVSTGLNLFQAAEYGVREIVATELGRRSAVEASTLPVEKEGDFFQDLYRKIHPTVSGIADKKITDADVEESAQQFRDGSQAVYTMVFDKAVRAEFQEGLKQGKDPALLAAELNNPLTELVAGIVFDPSTYFGLGIIGDLGKAKTVIRIPFVNKTIKMFGVTQHVPWRTVKRLPTFAEAIGLKVGTAKLASEADRFYDVAPEIKKAVAGLENVSTEAGALDVIKKTMGDVDAQLVKDAKNYGFTSYDASGKAALLGTDTKHIVGSIFGNSKDADDGLEVIQAMINMRHSDAKIRTEALLYLTSNPAGKVAFSEAGLKTSSLLSELTGKKMLNIIKAGGTEIEIAQKLGAALEDVTAKLIPSVDEMYDASKALKAGDETAEVARLANAYKDVPAYIKTTRHATRKYEKLWRPIVGAMSEVYMNWSARFFSRNILGQSLGITHSFGIAPTLEISAKATAGLNAQATTAIMARNDKIISDMLGSTIEGLGAGIGGGGLSSAGGAFAGKTPKKGFLTAAGNAESITRSEIAVITVRKTIKDALDSGALPDITGLKKSGVGDVEIGLLIQKVKDYHGNTAKAFEDLREATKGGFLESWRHMDMPPNLRKTLQQNNVLDELVDIQRTSQSPEEFAENAKKIVDDIIEKSTAEAAKEVSTIGHTVPTEIAEAVTEAQGFASKRVISDVSADTFTRKVQAWQNMRDSLTKAVHDLNGILSNRMGKLGLDQTPFTQELGKIENTFNNQYAKMGDVRNLVRKQYKLSQEGGNAAELWNNTIHGAGFNLAEIYPGVNPSTLTNKQFNNLLWEAYFDFGGNTWRTANSSLYEKQLGLLDEWSKAAGTTLEQSVGKLGNSGDNSMRMATQMRRQAEDLEDIQTISKKVFSGVDVPKGATLADMDLVSNNDFAGGRPRLLSAVNADRSASGLSKYETFSDVPFQEALSSLNRRKKTIPPPYSGGQPTYARATYEGAEGLANDMSKFIDDVSNRWGETTPVSKFSDEAEVALSDWKKIFDERMMTVKDKSRVLAQKQGDFILHDYNKTYLDLAAGYVMPYHYWTNRTYGKWAERIVEKPAIAATYLKYKRFMEQEHSDLPDWWKYNTKIDKLFGVDMETPLYFNLESTLNPVNGLTGVDFNDPYKRVDWLSKTIDDINSFGPTFMTPVQWAVAAELYAKGENEAASRWMGRLIPQTKTIKSALTLTGAKIPETPFSKANELDPFVNLLMGGVDPYERNRIGRTLASMVGEEIDGVTMTNEMADAASYEQEGPLWDEAARRATEKRAPGEIFSYFAGVGFKGRTESDVEIDKFYGEFNQMLALKDVVSPEDYKKGWNELRGRYDFMDSLLMAKKAGPERDRAYSYNVLNRIPPGLSSDFLSAAGLTEGTVQDFYDSKGDFQGWNNEEKERFMSAIVDLGAMLEMPNTATRNEWVDVRTRYSALKSDISTRLGEEIWDKVDYYYDLDRTKRKEFLVNNPDVEDALNAQSSGVAEDALLLDYYGSISSLERYHKSKISEALGIEFGEDIKEKWDMYYALRLVDTKKASQFKKEHPEMKAYSEKKANLEEFVIRSLVGMGDKLPQGQEPSIREDFVPESATQEELLGTVEAPQITWQEWQSVLSPPMQNMIKSYWEEGEDLDYYVRRQLEFDAKQFGMSADEALISIGISLR
ncbi:MAG: hypothetical protein GY755_22685 [Chloroflexi bacterium]|nr:hypothetical protein [Chloroflexota bacterium]